MKKCYNIKTWEKQEDVIINLDEQLLFISNKDKSCEEARKELGWSYGFARSSNNKNVQGWYDEYAQSIPSDPILAKLCEITRAKMYGDYIIFEDINKCDIIEYEIFYTETNQVCVGWNGLTTVYKYIIIDAIRDRTQHRIPYEKNVCGLSYKIIQAKENRVICNALEEYSKHLRNEENQFEEVKKLLNL